MPIDLEELERLAKAALLPWRIYKECQLDDHHEEIRNADGGYIKNVCDKKDEYILSACNAVPSLIARVRELERQREFFLSALKENNLCPANGRCWPDGSELEEWDCSAANNRECWIQAAKEAGE